MFLKLLNETQIINQLCNKLFEREKLIIQNVKEKFKKWRVNQNTFFVKINVNGISSHIQRISQIFVNENSFIAYL